MNSSDRTHWLTPSPPMAVDDDARATSPRARPRLEPTTATEDITRREFAGGTDPRTDVADEVMHQPGPD
jgi:hypothetical protein